MGIYATKSKWQQLLRPVVDFCVQEWVQPDVFTYGAVVLSGIAGFALFKAGTTPVWLWLVPPCVLLRLALNLLDGLVARRLDLASAWGEVKNEFGDRIADGVIFLGLAWGGYVSVRLAMLTLALVLCASFLGILGQAVGGTRVYAGIFGKGDRMLSLAVFTLYPLVSRDLTSYDWYLAAASLATTVTIIQRLGVIHGHAQSAR
jgi:CDP-diacylglycerol--glycerol-3-phosphate 3-phosphatidyltransferase